LANVPIVMDHLINAVAELEQLRAKKRADVEANWDSDPQLTPSSTYARLLWLALLFVTRTSFNPLVGGSNPPRPTKSRRP
jgi:hypothetical protein